MVAINHALAVRSDHSIGESILQVSHIVTKAKEMGFASVALTDTMTISSMVPFSTKCAKEGINPVVGCTIRVYDDPTYRKPSKASGESEKKNPFYNIKTYIRGEAGMKSLLKLLSKGNSADHFYYHSRVGLEDVLDLEDVIITTGDIFSLFHHKDHIEILCKLVARFGFESVFVELCPISTPLYDVLNQRALRAARGIGVGLLASYPVMYENAEDADTLDVLRAITSNGKLGSRTLPIPFTRDWCFESPKNLVIRMMELGKRIDITSGEIKHSVMNMDSIVNLCTYKFEKKDPSLPKMSENEFLSLVEACKTGWQERFAKPVLGHSPAPADMMTYKERLMYELRTLEKLGFSNYFLLVQDIVNWSKANGIIVGPGRGCFVPGSRVKLSHEGVTKQIQDVQLGDKVLAHDGSSQRVIANLCYQCDEEILELEFDNGIIIRCTREHEFYTANRGWVQAQELHSSDELNDVESNNPGRAKHATPEIAR